MSDVFDTAVALAKARAVGLLRDQRISLDDGRYVQRAIEDLEADGAELFAGAPELVRAVDGYLGARVGPKLADELGLLSHQQPEVFP